MALKVSGTTVIDDNANIISTTPLVLGTIVEGTIKVVAPSGTTANRPSTPATGTVYFDTDVGSLLSYNGSDWI